MPNSAAGVATAVAAIGFAAAGAAHAGDIERFKTKATFDDVRFELTNAITNRGLTIDYNGFIGKMLERTGPDVGSTKPIYKAAEFFTFCSAKLSRQTMEADPANVGLCPYVMFVYETVSNPGEVVVGYRELDKRGSKASRAAIAEVNKLLKGIAKDAVK